MPDSKPNTRETQCPGRAAGDPGEEYPGGAGYDSVKEHPFTPTRGAVYGINGRLADGPEKGPRCINTNIWDQLDRIILFGSYARGDYTEESDIDLLIVLNCGRSEADAFKDQTYEMASDISLDENVLVSVLLRDKQYFEENQNFLPFYKNIAKEGMIIYRCCEAADWQRSAIHKK